MPGRASPRSEGLCAAYGKERANDMAQTVMWRARLHNERTGMPKADISGANTSISLVWNPASKHQDTYQLQSHRRVSQLKQVQDFGLGGGAPAASPAPAASQSFEAAVRSLHAPRGAPPAAAAPQPRAFLDGETARLKACAHARNIGQTFLQAGNLQQAKAYLERAEQILQVDERHLRGKSPKDILDEFMSSRKDPMA